jgi:hypothetical protein
MKNYFLLLLFCPVFSYAQSIVFDARHFVSVAENSATRNAAEAAHNRYLTGINDNIDNMNTNMGSVVLAQNLIYNSLSNVNSALKNGLEVKNMAVIVADITYYTNQAMAMARTEPYLLIFTRGIAAEMKTRSVSLVTDISGFVLKEGKNVLADYSARDELFKKVVYQLQILDGLAYGAWKAMYWARERGIIATLNPFAGYINSDKTFVADILLNAKYLRQ